MASIICLIGIIGISIAICLQDFKERLISVWLIVVFAVLSFVNYLMVNTVSTFVENIIFCLLYFALCYAVLALYFYIKERKFQRILDSKIGWGDVLILAAIGFTVPFPEMIYFFTGSFILSMLTVLLSKGNKVQIPLAGVSIVLYSAYLLINELLMVF